MERRKFWFERILRNNEKRYGTYGRNVSWIVKKYEIYGRKVSWKVKRYEKYGRKVSSKVKRYWKWGRQLWYDMENMEEK